MKCRLLLLGILIFILISPCVRAQAVDANICDILANPESFDGKVVRIKGLVIAGFEEFAIKGAGCNQLVNSIWLDYPEGTNGKAGPIASLRLQLAKNNPAAVPSANRTAIKLDKNKDFKDFDRFLSTPAKAGDICLGCVKFTVSATLVGRLDGTKDTGLTRDSGGKAIGVGGFGNLNRYNARLVLQSVSDVSSQEIDYEKGGPTAVDMISPNRLFTPTQANGDLVKRGADAFGAPGEDNGVVVGFGGANEIPKGDGAKSATNSPDGVTFYATFEGDRLKGTALQIAMTHVGTHIADLRDSQTVVSNEILYGAEFRALQASLLAGAAARVKVLTLAGGYTIYNQSWSPSDLGKNAVDNMTGFLANWVNLTNPVKP